IGFAQWMTVGVPVMLLMLLGSWLFLTRISIRLDRGEVAGADELFGAQLDALGPWSKAEIRVGIVFVVAATAWVFRTVLDDHIPGLTDTSIAILAALSLFLIPSGSPQGGALVDWGTAR